jgi:hypothetical protein
MKQYTPLGFLGGDLVPVDAGPPVLLLGKALEGGLPVSPGSGPGLCGLDDLVAASLLLELHGSGEDRVDGRDHDGAIIALINSARGMNNCVSRIKLEKCFMFLD